MAERGWPNVGDSSLAIFSGWRFSKRTRVPKPLMADEEVTGQGAGDEGGAAAEARYQKGDFGAGAGARG